MAVRRWRVPVQVALHFAAAYGHQRCTRALLDAKANVNSSDSQSKTALMRACQAF